MPPVKCEDCQQSRASFGLPTDLKRRWCNKCAKNHVGASNLTSRKCEDCGQREKSYGILQGPGVPSTKRWCSICAKAHPNAAVLYKPKSVPKRTCEDCKLLAPSYGLPGMTAKRWCKGCAVAGGYGAVSGGKKCEDCGDKSANFGLANEITEGGKRPKARWCSVCSNAHDGTVAITKSQLCQDCSVSVARYALPGEKKKQWCRTCAKGHVGAVNIADKKCEDCDLITATYGIPGAAVAGTTSKKRWCSGCAKSNGHVAEGAVVVGVPATRKCEDCNLKARTYGIPTDGERRWCAKCAKQHDGAYSATEKSLAAVWGLAAKQKTTQATVQILKDKLKFQAVEFQKKEASLQEQLAVQVSLVQRAATDLQTLRATNQEQRRRLLQ